MKKLSSALLVLLIVSAGSARLARSEDDKKKEPASGSKAETHAVSKGPFRVVVPLEGVFVAQKMTEIVLRPDTWSEWTVSEAVEHGRAVKKGDPLLRMDRRKIEQEISDEERALKTAELSIEQLEAELKLLEPSMPVDLAEAERAKKNADFDLDHFLNTTRDLSVRSAEFMLKSAQLSLDYQQDELDQLEKMYKADDLTEETEEIILKRQRNAVEMAKFHLEMAKNERDQSLQVTLPRREADLRETKQRQTLALERAQSTLPLKLTKTKIDLEKQKYDRAKASEKLEKLKRDAELMTVLAPVDGVVYYGACAYGEWPSASSMADKLKPGGTLSAHQVILTIVDLDSLGIQASVPEKELYRLCQGVTCQVVPGCDPSARLKASVETVASVPGPNGKFFALLRLPERGEATSNGPRAVPGMKCTIKALCHDAAEALTIPTKALQTDDWDEGKHYVTLVDEGGKQTKRDVKVGHRGESEVEIVEGLKAGDKVLLGKPRSEKSEES